LKRLEQRGELKWRIVDQHERVLDTLDWMFAHKLAWVAQTGRNTLEVLTRCRDFYCQICSSALEARELVMIELVVGDVRVAAQIAFRAGARLDCDMIAWDPTWKDCGPGRVLDVATVRWAFENSVRLIELGVFGHHSKYRFSNTAVETAFHVEVGSGARGRLLMHAKKAAKEAQSILRNLSGPLIRERSGSPASEFRGTAG
jgi:CelD/BcsL family acetyltransferase involved in cellulose biosynthesis